jgi:hypothetical protein
LRCEPRVSVEIARRAIRTDRYRVSNLVAPASPACSLSLGFVPQEVVFATLTLRAALHYVRYSAALRSCSGFVDIKNRAASEAPTVGGLALIPEPQFFPAQQFLQVAAMAQDHDQ